jgi:hypothetical protein
MTRHAGEAAMAEHQRVSVRSQLRLLLKALQNVTSLGDAAGRKLVLRLIADDLGHPLPVVEYPQATAHLLSIVTACRDSVGGLEALVTALEQLEPGTIPVRAARRVVTQMLADGPPPPADHLPVDGALPTRQLPDPASGPHVWGGAIPLRNPDFVGRKDLLERLRVQLVEPGTTAVLPEALHGMGGVGKTQIVVEYIYRYAAEYDLIWWLPADQVSQVTSSYLELAKRIGLPAGSAGAAVRLVVDSLRKRRPPFERWLLVFDNAESPAEVTPFFPPSGHIIVTSRNPEWAGVARTVEVRVFSRHESVELLRRQVADIHGPDTDRLADALGDLPLAVAQAAAWRAQTGMAVDEYLQLIDRNLPDLLAGRSQLDTEPARSVEAVWSMSLQRLGRDHPAALQLLRLSAFFGPEPISKALFARVDGAPLPDELAAAMDDPIKLNQAVRELSRYSLVRVDPRNNTVQLHRLVVSFVKSELTEAERADLGHCVHLLLAHRDVGEPGSPRAWPIYAELLVHSTNADVPHCRRQDKAVRRLQLNLARYLLSSGDYAGAHELTRRASQAWRHQLGETDDDTLEMSRRYAVSLYRLGRSAEAQKVNQKIYDLVLRTFGESSPRFLDVADARAGDLRPRGLFVDELKSQQDVVERARRVLGDDHPATLRYANNLASCLRLTGQFDQARQLDQDTLARKRAVLGPDEQSIFMSANALAIDLRECGQWAAAAELFEQTIVRQCATIGADHPATIGAMRNLAVTKRLAGHYEEARALSETCVDGYRRKRGDDHVDTITAELGLSADLRRLGARTESLRLSSRSHRQFIATLGADHPFTLVSAINLAIVLRVTGATQAAHDLDQATSATLHRVFSAKHPIALITAINLASDLTGLGEFRAAAELGAEIAERSGATLGPEHPHTLAAAANRAIDLAQLGRAEEAAALRERTVSVLCRVVGQDHPMISAAHDSVRIDCEADTMQL